MSDLDDLIKVDDENILNSGRILNSFHPRLPAALDTAVGMFKTFTRCMKGALDDSADLATLDCCAKDLGIGADALVELIKTKARDGQAIERAWTAWSGLLARRVRAILFLLLYRQFMWGATDLLRMRLTAAIGYARQQAESLGLLLLTRNDPTVGNRWLRVASDEEGKAFYRKIQSQIARTMDVLGLRHAYEQGSGVSMHVRFASAVRGLSWKRELGSDEVLLSFQELQRDDSFSYFLIVVDFLGTQYRVFQALTQAFPEVSDPIWTQRVGIFGKEVGFLWERLEQLYPSECEKFREIARET